jgi:hypothetical protein
MERRTPRRPHEREATPLEQYLAAVEKRLRFMPAENRREELKEIAAHLACTVEDLHAHGYEENEAQSLAIKRFGSPRAVAADLRTAFLRGQPAAPGTLALAVGSALLWMKACGGLFSLLSMLLSVLGITAHTAHFAADSYLPLVWIAITSFVSYVCPGVMTAALAPRFALPGVAIAVIGNALMMAVIQVSTLAGKTPYISKILLSQGVYTVINLLLMMTAVLITSKWMERRPSRASVR